MNKDGYPTEEELEEIRTMDYKDWKSCIEKIQALWIWDDMVYTTTESSLDEPDTTILHINTGGWSGHEDVMSALMDNRMFWTCYWKLSQRGGHYEFEMRG